MYWQEEAKKLQPPNLEKKGCGIEKRHHAWQMEMGMQLYKNIQQLYFCNKQCV